MIVVPNNAECQNDFLANSNGSDVTSHEGTILYTNVTSVGLVDSETRRPTPMPSEFKVGFRQPEVPSGNGETSGDSE